MAIVALSDLRPWKEASDERTYMGHTYISMLAPGVPSFEEFNAIEAEGADTLAGCICCSFPIIASAYFCDECRAHHGCCLGGEFCSLEGCGRCPLLYDDGPFPWEV